jgi:hypothetical protein
MGDESCDEPCYCSQLMRLGDPLLWTLTLRGLGTRIHFTVTCTADIPLRATINIPGEFGEEKICTMTSLVMTHYSHHGMITLKRIASWIQKCEREIME